MAEELVKVLTDNPGKAGKWLAGETPGPVSDTLKSVGGGVQKVGQAVLPEPEPKTEAQAAHEANMDFINRNNPHWKPGMGATYANPVHRAKGGPVKAGGAPMKNVDNSGMTKEKC